MSEKEYPHKIKGEIKMIPTIFIMLYVSHIVYLYTKAQDPENFHL